MLKAMQRRRPLLMAVLAIVAAFAALMAPTAMARGRAEAAPAALASMAGMAHHDMGGAAPCAQGCCLICQALPVPVEASGMVLRVLPVTFTRLCTEIAASAPLERSTPPPRSA